jgi:rubrerythrin
MTEENIGLLEAIEIALVAENNAYEFYLDAFKKVKDERGKDLLKQLADFEQNHYNILTDLKKSLENDNKYIEYKGTSFVQFKAASITKQIEPDKDDVLSILSIAIDAEENANKHYLKMAKQTTDVKGKEMFLKLAEEELMHRRILSDEFYQLSNKSGSWFWGD